MRIKTSGRFRRGESFWRFLRESSCELFIIHGVSILFFCFICMVDVEIDKSKKTSVSEIEICRIFTMLQFCEEFCLVEVVFYYKI